MFGNRRWVRKTINHEAVDCEAVNIANPDCLEDPSSEKTLTRTDDWKCVTVNKVIFLSEQKLVVAVSQSRFDNEYAIDNSMVCVYDLDTSGEPRAILSHEFDWEDDDVQWVNDVVQLDCDLVASVGTDKQLFSWLPKSAQRVGQWKHKERLNSIAKLDDSRVIVGDEIGKVIVLTHDSGTDFRVLRRFRSSHSSYVNEIVVHRDLIVTCSHDKTAKLWSTTSSVLLATLRHANHVKSAAVSDNFIVTKCFNGSVCVYRNNDNYPLDFMFSMDLRNNITFLSDDIIAVGDEDAKLSFISLSTKSFLSRIQTKDRIFSFVVLCDGRIALGTDGGVSIISPPESVRAIVEQSCRTMYQSLSIVASPVPPLRAAWIAAQDGQLSFAEACTTVITSENCSASLDEWSVAHDLLMEAVKRSDIFQSRHYGGADFHWHSELYQHCAKLAMGEKCIKFVKSKFKEAENAGVIAEGQGESFINTIGIRHDMDKDNQFLVHAVYQLFLRQAEMDVRLREVLHYQKVQQMTALVNALVGLCIPVGGGVVTNVISGGAAILNDFQVCGLVESLLGVAKDASDGFGSGRMVDRFLRKSNAVLRVEEWTELPAAKRKVVEDAASNLGLSIEELRDKLLIVAGMQTYDDGETPCEQVEIAGVDDDVQGLDEDSQIEAGAVVSPSSHGVEPTSTAESVNLGGAGPSTTSTPVITTPNDIEKELEMWRGKGIGKDIVGRLRSGQVATCLAAYVVNYDGQLGELFIQYKSALSKRFHSEGIFGEHFTDADDEDRKMLFDEVISALQEARERQSVGPAKMRAKKFIHLVSGLTTPQSYHR